MSSIDDLIAEHCPAGVEFKPLGELLDYEQPTKYLVTSTAYNDAYETPVLTAGQTFVLGRTNETHGVYPASSALPVVIFDDFTTAFKWVDFKFKAKSSAMKMITPKQGVGVDFKFVFYAMQNIRYEPQDHARQWISVYSQFKIPVPPLAVQREIAAILDKMETLTAELEAELEYRSRQYAYYRDSLLTFAAREGGRWATLNEVVEYTNGKAHERLVSPAGDVPLVTARFISRNGEANRFVPADDVLTPALSGDVALVLSDLPRGRALARTFFVDRDDAYAINQRIARLRVLELAELLPRFLFHVLDRNPGLIRYDNGVDQTHLTDVPHFS